MAYMIAVLMAGLSFLLNKLLLRYLGAMTIISAGPVVEEAAKTILAYYLAVDILTVHALFGVIEAGYDWYYQSQNTLLPPLLSIVGHSLFGAATVAVLSLTNSLWLGLAGGITLHVIYNLSVVRLLAAKHTDKAGKRDKP